jgi:hypothetical protein
MKKKFNTKNISDNIIYEIRKNPVDLFIFINPKTQRSTLFFKNTNSGKIEQARYDGDVEYPIDSALNYTIYYGGTQKEFDKNTRVNYVNKIFYIMNEGLEDLFVITLDDLCPEIREEYYRKPILEIAAKHKLIVSKPFRLIQYTEDDYWTQKQNSTIHQVKNLNFGPEEEIQAGVEEERHGEHQGHHAREVTPKIKKMKTSTCVVC